MPEIPSDITASAAQAGFQAREITKDREARRAGHAEAATRQVKTVDDAGTTVETSDDDSRVFTDAEGQGGQGRSFEDEPSPEPEKCVPAPPGISTDKDGRLHVDLEA